MIIFPQEKINNFEIGIAYASLPRQKFLQYLLSIKEFIHNPMIVQCIKDIVKNIEESTRYAFWSHVKGFLPHRDGIDKDAYDYTKTENYHSSENLLFKLMNYNETYHNPEIIQMYQQIKDVLLVDIPEKDQEQILKGVELSNSFLQGQTQIPEFIINGQTMTIVDKDTYFQYLSFMKRYRQKNSIENNPLTESIYHDGYYALIETGTDLYKDFMKDLILDKVPEHIEEQTKTDISKKVTEQSVNDMKEKKDIQNIVKEEKEHPGKEKQKNIEVSHPKESSVKKIKTREEERRLQENIFTEYKDNIVLQKNTKCKIVAIDKIISNKDDNFLYVKIPDTKIHGLPFYKESINLKRCIVKIPMAYVKAISDKKYEISIPMSDDFKLTSPYHKDKLVNGQTISVKGHELIRAFDIKEIEYRNKELQPTISIDGVVREMAAKDGYVFSYSGDTATIISGPKEGIIEIPSFVDIDGKNYSITKIETNAFANSQIEAIKIPDTVKEIDSCAFVNSSQLKEVSITGLELEKIGNSAFRDCKALEHVYIPNSVTSIGINPFENCKKATLVKEEIENSKSNFTVENGMLIDSTNTLISFLQGSQTNEQLIIPDNVEKIGNSAFKDIKNIKSVIIPEQCKEIEAQAFERASIESVKVNGTSINIGDRAFENSHIKEINHETFISVGQDAFSGTNLVMGNIYEQEQESRSIPRLQAFIKNISKLQQKQEVKIPREVKPPEKIKNQQSNELEIGGL